jgi:hypothetical protein
MLAAGLAIDMGYLRYEKRRMQAAADSAAIAGASELQYGDWQSAAQTDASYNGFTNGTNGVAVTPNCPPLTGPFAGASCTTSFPTSSDSYVEVVVTSTAPTFFMKVAGVNSVSLSARAVAHLGTASGCVYGLQTGVQGGSVVPALSNGYPIDFDLQLPGCRVYDNSSLILTSQELDALGVGYDGTLSIAGATVTPAPVPIAPVSNPLAYLPQQPTPAPCSTTIMPETLSTGTATVTAADPGCGVTINGSANVTFTPGIYTGPINISGQSTVTFNPGTYVLRQGLTIYGDQTYGAGVTVNGSGVTFYNTGNDTGNNTINICTAPILPTAGCPPVPIPMSTATNAITLSAPTTGSYAGILMFQDPGDTQPAMLNGNNIYALSNTTTLQGAMYFPNAQLSVINLSSPPNGYALAIAQTVAFGGFVNFGSNYSSLPNQSSPIMTAVLAE